MPTPPRSAVAGIALLAAVIAVLGALAAVRSPSFERDGARADAVHAPSVAAGPRRTTVAFDAQGDTVDLPEGWHVSDRPMAPELSINPRELLSLGTMAFTMPPSGAVCVGNAPPATPVAAMGPDDIFLWLVEWYPTDSRMPSVETSSRRPTHFVVEGNDRSCVTAASPHVRGGGFQFTDRGRVFSLYYVLGTNVTGDSARVVEQVLDSLTFAS